MGADCLDTRWSRIGVISVILLVSGILFILFRFVWMDQTIRGLIGKDTTLVDEQNDFFHVVMIASGSNGTYWPEVYRGAIEASKLYRVDFEQVTTEQSTPEAIARMIEKYTAAKTSD